MCDHPSLFAQFQCKILFSRIFNFQLITRLENEVCMNISLALHVFCTSQFFNFIQTAVIDSQNGGSME